MDEFDIGESYSFTGILTGQKRDIYQMTPKTMLLNIRHNNITFRDHCWIPLSGYINDILPLSHHKKKIRVSFTATVFEYRSSEGMKIGLKRIDDIRILKRDRVSKLLEN